MNSVIEIVQEVVFETVRMGINCKAPWVVTEAAFESAATASRELLICPVW